MKDKAEREAYSLEEHSFNDIYSRCDLRDYLGELPGDAFHFNGTAPGRYIRIWARDGRSLDGVVTNISPEGFDVLITAISRTIK